MEVFYLWIKDVIHSFFLSAEKEKAETLSFYETIEKDHGRMEIRRYTTSADTDFLTGKNEWANLQRIGKAENIRDTEGQKSREIRYYISDEDYSAEDLL
uniref:hypothetical protein n=1 Tax=Agathobacter sp. TaxID=2021311 RepID=UPI0040566652